MAVDYRCGTFFLLYVGECLRCFCLIRYEREGLRKVGKKLFLGEGGGWFGLWMCSLWRWVDFYGVGWDGMRWDGRERERERDE